jgi:hypothetical protein
VTLGCCSGFIGYVAEASVGLTGFDARVVPPVVYKSAGWNISQRMPLPPPLNTTVLDTFSPFNRFTNCPFIAEAELLQYVLGSTCTGASTAAVSPDDAAAPSPPSLRRSVVFSFRIIDAAAVLEDDEKKARFEAALTIDIATSAGLDIDDVTNVTLSTVPLTTVVPTLVYNLTCAITFSRLAAAVRYDAMMRAGEGDGLTIAVFAAMLAGECSGSSCLHSLSETELMFLVADGALLDASSAAADGNPPAGVGTPPRFAPLTPAPPAVATTQAPATTQSRLPSSAYVPYEKSAAPSLPLAPLPLLLTALYLGLHVAVAIATA